MIQLIQQLLIDIPITLSVCNGHEGRGGRRNGYGGRGGRGGHDLRR